MKKPRIFRPIPIEIRSDIKKLFNESIKKYEHLPASTTNIKLGEIVVVNWACAWNDPRDVGKVGMVALTDKRFCVICIGKVLEKTSVRIAFFRAEDLTPTKDLIKG